MNHQDRTIDFLTSAEADAVYEVVIEHVPLVLTHTETISDAIDRTREELRKHIRKTLNGIRPGPIVDHAVGRIRVTQRKGKSPVGAPYDADCFFTCGRLLDNERAAQALNGSLFGTPPVRINAKANGRCIAARDVKRCLETTQQELKETREQAARDIERERESARAALKSEQERANNERDKERERTEAALKTVEQQAAKQLAEAGAKAAARECALLQEHAAKLDDMRLNWTSAERNLEGMVHMYTLADEAKSEALKLQATAELDLKAHRQLSVHLEARVAELEGQLKLALAQSTKQQQATTSPPQQQQKATTSTNADAEANAAGDSVSTGEEQADGDDEDESDTDSYVTSILQQ